ncbi:kinase-like domain-containing protein [Cubamyces lactineus]|nr:kinase-like domain-containing protein [Cubamyces lactineus]
MATQARPKRLPNHAILDGEALRVSRLRTSQGLYNLAPKELFWQARYRYFKDHGYLLRPRYSPEWEPSWTGTNLDPTFCEDSIMLIDYQVIDATRISTNEKVAIKSFVKQGDEERVAQFFASVQDPRNHCIRIHEILPDPFDSRLGLMIMPYLRPCDDPEFATVGDVVEFVDQTLEGVAFMHEHNIAHRDVAVANIMMDARALYPNGYHPVRLGYTPDALYPVSPLPRAGRSIKYYYIDFGLTTWFPPGSSTLVIGDVGRAEVPELSDTTPYDAFKVDIYALGSVYSEEFGSKYKNTDFLVPLIEQMMRQRPEERPTVQQALREWQRIRATLNDSLFRWRLVPKSEQGIERVVNDTVAAAWEGIYHLKKLMPVYYCVS